MRAAQAFIRPRWRELVARAYHNSLYNQFAPHFGKLSEFDKVLSFAQGSLILRSTFAQGSLGVYAPHFGKLSEFDKVLSFGASRTGFYLSE